MHPNQKIMNLLNRNRNVSVIKYLASILEVDITTQNNESKNTLPYLVKDNNLTLVKYLVDMNKIPLDQTDSSKNNTSSLCM